MVPKSGRQLSIPNDRMIVVQFWNNQIGPISVRENQEVRHPGKNLQIGLQRGEDLLDPLRIDLHLMSGNQSCPQMVSLMFQIPIVHIFPPRKHNNFRDELISLPLELLTTDREHAQECDRQIIECDPFCRLFPGVRNPAENSR
jgi:hypothetical protein